MEFILDIGCGDGDIANLIEYISKNSNRDVQINIYGIDINASRINNCKKLVKAKAKNIKLNFIVDDLAKKNYSHFRKIFLIIVYVLEFLRF